ncbi:hypothetical protein DFJ74DRAFT_665766 [Hyaloraphidium curvatum]|nr:hypothetical protein DFJ74DRAFT_665766 [Hyaloraphidium curvatum]
MTLCDARHVWISGDGTVGARGACNLDPDYPPPTRSPFELGNWVGELGRFRLTPPPKCDTLFSKTVMATHGDSPASVYHKLCDFPNLYLSLWAVGLQDEPPDAMRVLYHEPNAFYVGSPFDALHALFTTEPLIHLSEHANRTLCFDRVVFAVKPRSLFTFFYNQPVPSGCRAGPGSFLPAYSRAQLAALFGNRIAAERRRPRAKLKIVLLSRSGPTRRLLNEADLAAAARRRFPRAELLVARFGFGERVPFEDQVRLTSTADVLAGIHGAGLAHALFLPPWAAVVELYDAGDRCFRDLSRLLGLGYAAGGPGNIVRKEPGPDEARLGEEKYWNYAVSEKAFLGLLGDAVDHVLGHPVFPGLDGGAHGEL